MDGVDDDDDDDGWMIRWSRVDDSMIRVVMWR